MDAVHTPLEVEEREARGQRWAKVRYGNGSPAKREDGLLGLVEPQMMALWPCHQVIRGGTRSS